MSNEHHPPEAYEASLDAALAFGAQAAPRLADRARTLMSQRAAAARDDTERKLDVEAERFLGLRTELFVAAFPVCLQREFAAPAAAATAAAPALSFDALELMEEDQVDETVEVLRGQQIVLAEVDADLAVLNALISAARGRKVVSAAANPFLPDAWVRALRGATVECRVPLSVRTRWLHSLCEALGPELATCYRELSALLRRHGIAAASFVVNALGGTGAATSSKPAGAVAATAAPRGAAAAALAPPAPVLNLRDLRRLLTGTGERAAHGAPPGTDADAGASQEHAMTVPWAFEALQEMKSVDQVVQRMQQRRSAGAIAPERGGAPESLSAAQVLGQEVVRVMVENITGDQRLPTPMRQALLDLEPALLRLVLNDPRFFRDKDHPTRRFLAETTERSLAWPSPDQPGFAAFFGPVREAVDALAQVTMETAEPFEVALQSLEQAWAHEEARSRARRAKAAQALVRAERRNLVALEIADELRGRPDVIAAPLEIRRFVTGPWAQVIAAARMRGDATADAQALADLVNDLIWSTQPRLAAENRVRLARIVPPMLATLRRGLASIEYSRDETQRFLDYVGDLHQMVLRPQTGAPRPATRDDLDALLDEREIWLEPAEARDSGLMDLSSLDTSGGLSGAKPSTASSGADPGALSIERFQAGIWVDLLLDRAWSRWRLAWVGSHSLLFMFTDGAGGSRSMTRGTLAQLIALGGARLVADQPVLSSALDAVATRALRNTMDTTL
jgi:hypothetical protein